MTSLFEIINNNINIQHIPEYLSKLLVCDLSIDEFINIFNNRKCFVNLPDDLIGYIVNFLDLQDTLNLRLVSQDLKHKVYKHNKNIITTNNIFNIKKIIDKKLFKKQIFNFEINNTRGFRYTVDDLQQVINFQFYPVDDKHEYDTRLAELLTQCEYIQQIRIKNREEHALTHVINIRNICKALHKNTSLKLLELVNFILDDESINELGACIKNNKYLQKLIIANFDFNTNTQKILSDAILINSTLTSITVSNIHDLSNIVRNINLTYLLQTLKTNKNINALDISKNYLDLQSIEKLCELLKTNTTLEILNINKCINSKYLHLVVDALKTNKTNIRELHIFPALDDIFKNEDIIDLINIIENNKHIHTLSLKITNKTCGYKLRDMLKNNKNIKYINFDLTCDKNKSSYNIRKKINKIQKINKNLTINFCNAWYEYDYDYDEDDYNYDYNYD